VKFVSLWYRIRIGDLIGFWLIEGASLKSCKVLISFAICSVLRLGVSPIDSSKALLTSKIRFPSSLLLFFEEPLDYKC